MEQEAWQILIVEDDQRLAELTQEYLQSNGLQVAIESDGARAAARILMQANHANGFQTSWSAWLAQVNEAK